ncbi:hypothetical protein FGO68_gene72 [Halteria grandinella]|uniref:TLC domain-containing protein n=1 Tax=Halteria grandinella TaxID=5974 RepID=A0A8J8NL54_HALGN|nr:hypothetical protein FGO68_gene72 [Halteria grandinella]
MAREQPQVKQGERSRAVRSRLSKLLWLGLLVVLLILGPFSYFTYEMVQKILLTQPSNNTYRWPQISDFWLALVLMVICLAVENFLVFFLTPHIETICREQVDLQVRNIRSKKAVKNIFKGLYFVASTSLGFWMLKDSYIMPPSLGGRGSLSRHLEGYPFWEHPPYYNVFYMGCMGYNLAGLFQELFIEPKGRDDYIEMVLHHSVTVYLIVFSYLGNFFIGAPIILIHNSSDMLFSFLRALNETKYNETAFKLFVVTMSVWLYMRCYIFPQVVYVAYQSNYELASPWLAPLFRFCLSCLQFLHFYWTFLLFKIIHNKLTTGVVDDLIQKNQLSSERKAEEGKQE